MTSPGQFWDKTWKLRICLNITKLNDFAITKTCNEFLFFVLIQGQVPCVKKYDYKKY